MKYLNLFIVPAFLISAVTTDLAQAQNQPSSHDLQLRDPSLTMPQSGFAMFGGTFRTSSIGVTSYDENAGNGGAQIPALRNSLPTSASMTGGGVVATVRHAGLYGSPYNRAFLDLSVQASQEMSSYNAQGATVLHTLGHLEIGPAFCLTSCLVTANHSGVSILLPIQAIFDFQAQDIGGGVQNAQAGAVVKPGFLYIRRNAHGHISISLRAGVVGGAGRNYFNNTQASQNVRGDGQYMQEGPTVSSWGMWGRYPALFSSTSYRWIEDSVRSHYSAQADGSYAQVGGYFQLQLPGTLAGIDYSHFYSLAGSGNTSEINQTNFYMNLPLGDSGVSAALVGQWINAVVATQQNAGVPPSGTSLNDLRLQLGVSGQWR